MLLHRLNLRDFRRFHRHECVLSPGFNIIWGNNEEGKSTLREALAVAMFQDPKTSDKKILALKRWGAREQFRLELEFEADGQSYLLKKDFQSKSASLRALSSGEEMQDCRAIQGRLLGFLGLPTKAVFDSTARITQRDITDLQAGDEIADLLQKTITGGKDDVLVSRVLDQLDEALKALRSRARGNPGPLVILPERIASIDSAIAARGALLREREDAERKIMAKRDVLEATKGRLADNVALELDCRERLRLEGALADARRNEATLERRVELGRALEKSAALAEGELAQLATVACLPSEQLARMAVLQVESTSAPSASMREQASPSYRPFIVAIAALIIVAGLAASQSSSYFWVLCLAGLGMLVWEMTRVRRLAEVLEIASKMRIQEKRETAAKAARELEAMVAGVGCLSMEELLARREEAARLRADISNDRARLETVLEEGSLIAMEEDRRQASGQARQFADALEEPRMRLAALDHVAYQRLTRAIQEDQTAVSELSGEIDELRVVMLSNKAAREDLYSLEEERDELRRALAGVEERQSIWSLTRAVIEEARRDVMVSAQATLQRELGDVVGDITDGRYTEVLVDPSTLDLKLRTSEREEPVAVKLEGDLSTGTVEQVYVAARFVLAGLLSGGRQPPIVLDDPFVTFDSARRAAVLRECDKLAARQQILLFTCHDGYEGTGRNVIRLPALT